MVLSREVNENSSLMKATEDFIGLFQEATGEELSIFKDNEVGSFSQNKYIVVGKNDLFNQSAISTEQFSLGRDGFLIKKLEDDIFIVGDYEQGTVNGLYGFLKREFGFDCFSADCYTINTGVQNISFLSYYEVPDMEKRSPDNGFITESKISMLRMGGTYRSEAVFGTTASVHNLITFYLPKNDYYSSHPSWYAEGEEGGFVNQVCYTAHGNASELDEMQNTIVEVIKKNMKKYPESYLYVLGMEDNAGYCDCPTCQANYQKFNGSKNGAVIEFCNTVADKVSAWFETDGFAYKREFKILFMSYEAYTSAPAVLEGGKYVPIDGTVCNENVGVFIAPVHYDFQRSLNDTVNADYKTEFEKWKAVSNNVALYLYQTNFAHYLVAYDNFEYMQEIYSYFADNFNVLFIVDAGQRNSENGATGFQVLKNYLATNLQWNTDFDTELLTDKFFDNYFGLASESMRAYYESYRSYWKGLKDNGALPTSGFSIFINYEWNSDKSLTPNGDGNTFTYEILSTWKSYINQAFLDILPLETENNEIYQVYYDRICMERIMVDYLLIKRYYSTCPNAEEIKAEVKADIERFGISLTTEDAKPWVS